MQNIGLYVVEGGERLSSQSVTICAIPATDATGEQPTASHCDSSNHHSTEETRISGK